MARFPTSAIRQTQSWDPFESWDLFETEDPFLGLPQQPYQYPIVDPAQDPFQYPFQFPGQNLSQPESQFAPVDVPENNLQQAWDPFSAWVDLNSDPDASHWSQQFSPGGTLVENAWEIGKAQLEQQGFDLGVFGVLSPSDTLLGNLFRANRWMNENPDAAWDWAGDFAQAFAEFGAPLAGWTDPITKSLGEMFAGIGNLDWLDLNTNVPSVEPVPDVVDFLGGSYHLYDAPEEEGAVAGMELEIARAGKLGANPRDFVGVQSELASSAGIDIGGIDEALASVDVLDLAASIL